MKELDNSEIKLARVAHKSADYWKCVELRDRLLRKPLGLEFSAEELEEENNQWHLCLFLNDEIVACLCLVPLKSGEIKMRQVAVDHDFQSFGLGTRLVKYSENVAIDSGFKLMSLHARENALAFYNKMNYLEVGNRFLEVGIEHFRMEKEL